MEDDFVSTGPCVSDGRRRNISVKWLVGAGLTHDLSFLTLIGFRGKILSKYARQACSEDQGYRDKDN